MSNFKKLVEARMAETGEGWQAASKYVREQALKEESQAVRNERIGAEPVVVKLPQNPASPLGRMPMRTFLGPAIIPPGQMIDLVHRPTEGDPPWTVMNMWTPASLADKPLFIASMVVGNEEQMMGGPIPFAAFSERAVGINLGDVFITNDKPFKMRVHNAGSTPEVAVLFICGVAHFPKPDETAQQAEPRGERALLPFESVVVPPHGTVSARLDLRNRYSIASYERLQDHKEYDITRLSVFGEVHNLPIELELFVDGESQTNGFVAAELFDITISFGAIIESFNADREPPKMPKFTKKVVKRKTKVEIIVRNNGDHPVSFQAHLECKRQPTTEELQAKLAPHPWRAMASDDEAMPVGFGDLMRIAPPALSKPHSERFPWNPDGERETVIIAPGETKDLSASPQLIFRAERLIVDKESRDGFEIVDVRTGGKVSEAFYEPIPAAHFYERNEIDLKLPVTQIGMLLRLFVKNTTDKPLPFGASITGYSLQ